MPFKDKYDYKKIKLIVERETLFDIHRSEPTTHKSLMAVVKKELKYKEISESPIKKTLNKDERNNFYKIKVPAESTYVNDYENNRYRSIHVTYYISKRCFKTILKEMERKRENFPLFSLICLHCKRYKMKTFKVNPTLYMTHLKLRHSDSYPKITDGFMGLFGDKVTIHKHGSRMFIVSKNRQVHRYVKYARLLDDFDFKRLNKFHKSEFQLFLIKMCEYIKTMPENEFEKMINELFEGQKD